MTGTDAVALLPAALLFWLAAWGVIAMRWICAEAIVFALSGTVVVAQLIERQGRIGHITVAPEPGRGGEHLTRGITPPAGGAFA